ncbi:MAG TPA: hypothetical protein VMH38_06545 [Thermoplasmata archaeon]|nr:hypothetical protein [Thermoplasmata archaeon]
MKLKEPLFPYNEYAGVLEARFSTIRKLTLVSVLVSHDPLTRLPFGGVIVLDLAERLRENGCGRGTATRTTRTTATTITETMTQVRRRWLGLDGTVCPRPA